MIPNLTLYLVLLFLIVYIALSMRVVDERYRVPVFLFGRYRWTAGPGITVIPLFLCQPLKDVSIQLRTGRVTVRNARTKDNVPLAFELTYVSRVLPHRVKDVILKIESGITAIEKLLDAIAVEIAGHTDYANIQGREKEFSTAVLEELKKRVADWGIEVQTVDMSNIEITDPVIAEAIARVAQAEIDAKAEEILSERLLASAGRYGKSVFELRQLISMERVTASGNASVHTFPSDIARILSSSTGSGKSLETSLAEKAANSATTRTTEGEVTAAGN